MTQGNKKFRRKFLRNLQPGDLMKGRRPRRGLWRVEDVEHRVLVLGEEEVIVVKLFLRPDHPPGFGISRPTDWFGPYDWDESRMVSR